MSWRKLSSDPLRGQVDGCRERVCAGNEEGRESFSVLANDANHFGSFSPPKLKKTPDPFPGALRSRCCAPRAATARWATSRGPGSALAQNATGTWHTRPASGFDTAFEPRPKRSDFLVRPLANELLDSWMRVRNKGGIIDAARGSDLARIIESCQLSVVSRQRSVVPNSYHFQVGDLPDGNPAAGTLGWIPP
jgi:hypothetical protein